MTQFSIISVAAFVVGNVQAVQSFAASDRQHDPPADQQHDPPADPLIAQLIQDEQNDREQTTSAINTPLLQPTTTAPCTRKHRRR